MSQLSQINQQSLNTKPFYWVALITLLGVSVTVGINLLGDSRFALLICAYLFIFALLWSRPMLLLTSWLSLSPIAAYLLRYPLEQSLITFDRIVVTILALFLIKRVIREPNLKLPLGNFELCWLGFAGIALADCFTRGQFSIIALKTAIDAFWLPLILFIVVRHGIELPNFTNKILIGLIGLAYLLLPIGLAELLTRIDILIYSGGELIKDGVIRPNGPYVSDNSYALISLLIGFALLHWPAAAGLTLSRRLRWHRSIATACALLAAMLPQFRAVVLVMVCCLGISLMLLHGWRVLIKVACLAMLLLIAGAPILLVLTNTNFYQSRIADPTNAYSRLATYQVAGEIIKAHWARGVGLSRYEEYYQAHFAPKEPVTNKAALKNLPQSTPHSNFLSVWAELGLIGLIPYLLATGLLLFEGIRLVRAKFQVAGTAIILLVCAYTFVGATLTSGYYSDLNLVYFFLLGIFLAAPGAKSTFCKDSEVKEA